MSDSVKNSAYPESDFVEKKYGHGSPSNLYGDLYDFLSCEVELFEHVYSAYAEFKGKVNEGEYPLVRDFLLSHFGVSSLEEIELSQIMSEIENDESFPRKMDEAMAKYSGGNPYFHVRK